MLIHALDHWTKDLAILVCKQEMCCFRREMVQVVCSRLAAALSSGRDWDVFPQ